MSRIFLLFIASCCTVIAHAQQDIKTYVTENTAQVNSIDPDDTAYADLDALGNAVGDAKIVMLGEQDHGDGASFVAKTRLIKYLHEKKGFNVVAFESDFFALNRGWDNVNKTEEDIYKFLKANITGVWSYCDACQYLFKKLVPQSFLTNRPLQITGIDNQLAMTYSNKNLTHQLDSVCSSLQLPVTKENNYRTDILPAIDSMTKFLFRPKTAAFFDKTVEQLSLIKSQLEGNAAAGSFWKLVIENLIHMTLEFKYLPADMDKGRNERDVQMAHNLKWLSGVKYPNEKIVVWAQNFHVSKYSGHYPGRIFNRLVSMGTELTKDPDIDRKTYVIGFTSSSGETGLPGGKPYGVETPPKNSFEKWINEAYSYAFTDFTKFNASNSASAPDFTMNGSVVEVLHKKYRASWTRIFDGVFYIKQMYPCKPAK